ncbi:hypothetical protein F0L68_27800 [Solihabitans fulvus]|uniref:Uncharacterized protein n=1 Tax=Solihabitans fulvus TaxID=1892852 RepID=A0A5B2WZH0_9PSEU|nr:hypothetical protein [Solihabitans fulvus]KAA2255986.1 hypothetical protein F0L68_27800 [Solihabitans fulvus]
MIGRVRLFAVVTALAVAIVGCATPRPTPGPNGGWREVPPPTAGARVLAVARIGAGVLVSGSVPGPQSRAPAAWTTTDGTHWQAVALRPNSPYAGQAELTQLGVAGGEVTALGLAFGGAHGNPRLTVWRGTATELVEHEQPFELFGGPHALAVNGLAAVPGTALLVGQWDGASGRAGATAWTSADGALWRRQADDPALASAVDEQTSASGVAATSAGFLVAGHVLRGAELTPSAWDSADGVLWRRLPVPAGGGAATADRVACAGEQCVLVGAAVGARWTAMCWPVASGAVGQGLPGPSGTTVQVSQVLSRGTRMVAVLRVDGTARLGSTDRTCADWQDLTAPVGSRDAVLGDLPGGLLLATTDQDSSRLWLRSD